jgi:hypothetical protein
LQYDPYTGCCYPPGPREPEEKFRGLLVRVTFAAIVAFAIYLGFRWRSSRIEGGEYKAKKTDGDGDEGRKTDGGGK